MSTVTELRQDAQIIFLSDLLKAREAREAQRRRDMARHPAGRKLRLPSPDDDGVA